MKVQQCSISVTVHKYTRTIDVLRSLCVHGNLLQQCVLILLTQLLKPMMVCLIVGNSESCLLNYMVPVGHESKCIDPYDPSKKLTNTTH